MLPSGSRTVRMGRPGTEGPMVRGRKSRSLTLWVDELSIHRLGCNAAAASIAASLPQQFSTLAKSAHAIATSPRFNWRILPALQALSPPTTFVTSKSREFSPHLSRGRCPNVSHPNHPPRGGRARPTQRAGTHGAHGAAMSASMFSGEPNDMRLRICPGRNIARH